MEKHLVKKGLYEIAKSYILYRAKRMKEREEEKKQNLEKARLGKLKVKKPEDEYALISIWLKTEEARFNYVAVN